MTSRRTVLKGAAVLSATALAAGPAAALARFAEGPAEVTVVSDGHLELPLGFVFPELAEDERRALLVANGMATDGYRPDCNITIVRSGDRLAVFDVGAGAHFQASAGKLAANLSEAGIDPATVTDVIFTHAHPDHLWGLVDDFDELVFAEAVYRVAQAEWDFWRADDTLDLMPEERKSFVVGAQARLAAIEDRVALFAPGAEVFPGVEAMDTSGHTPGHVSFVVHAGSVPLVITGDALTNPVSFTRPQMHTGSDQDQAAGARTRMRLLDRLVADRARLIGFHLPHPGLGRAERDGAAYRFVADA